MLVAGFAFQRFMSSGSACIKHRPHDRKTVSQTQLAASLKQKLACNVVQAMPRYLHKIERLDKLASVPRKPGGRNAQFCVCASLVWTRLNGHSVSTEPSDRVVSTEPFLCLIPFLLQYFIRIFHL